MLDAASLLHLFAQLSGTDLAHCACVSHSWRTVAYSERLWQNLVQELEHPQLRREDTVAGKSAAISEQQNGRTLCPLCSAAL
jgi:hypothetical protein